MSASSNSIDLLFKNFDFSAWGLGPLFNRLLLRNHLDHLKPASPRTRMTKNLHHQSTTQGFLAPKISRHSYQFPERQFPRRIIETALRTDVAFYLETLRRFILIGLSFEDRTAPKKKRYEKLLVEIKTAGWKGDLVTAKVGCRQSYHDTLPSIF